VDDLSKYGRIVGRYIVFGAMPKRFHNNIRVDDISVNTLPNII